MGRDGRVHHRGIEVTGAMRGVVALAALMTPVAIVWALDALSSPARLELYLRANVAMLWLWIPITLVALVSFLVARLSPWQVRSSLNSMVFSVLELLRPLVASAGIVIAAIATSDVRVALVGSFAVIMAMQTSRVTRRWWYSKPVTLDALGAFVARRKMTP
ncbi:MAG: hypothetical protein CVT68_06605 [Actinobacteria bacterium HGW-Actinobacteria-8]|nr:MAG: hypothetical protein CVT68_06605 [Actinobacteria bacterium HGW-Actinobacteria-8]